MPVLREEVFAIAEHFVSPQGEGLFTGTMMQFVRLAGCSVGKQFTQAEKAEFKVLNNYQTKCTTWQGREFACDTNYKTVLAKMSVEGIEHLANGSGMRRVCLTGGEPLNHPNFHQIISYLLMRSFYVHVETSGTLPLGRIRAVADYQKEKGGNLWITVSPKFGYLAEQINEYADEVKILVDEADTTEEIMGVVASLTKWRHTPGVRTAPIIWVQPINNENSLNMDNVKKCLGIIQKYPMLRLSIQAHKVIGVR